jgi:tetratricopeptide (TPR) repeat protein
MIRRLLLALTLVLITATAVYGYLVTRREREYRQLVLDGDYAMARGNTFAAASAFGKAIELKPDSMVGYLKRGEAHRRRGDLDAAATDLERAAALDPSAPRAFELLGDTEADRNHPDRAAEHYEASIRLDDLSPRVLYKLALARHIGGRTTAAVEVLRRAVSLDARFAEAYYLLGVCERELHRPADAEQSLRRAVAITPSLFAAREQLAELYEGLGRRADRIRQLELLVSADPGAARHVALAMAVAQGGQRERAVRQLQTAQELYPDSAGIALALGRVWLETASQSGERDALDQAIGALQRAAGLDPSSAALMELGRARLAAADLDGAERTLRQATDAPPVEPEAFLYLADAAARAGHQPAARRALLAFARLRTPRDGRDAAMAALAGDVHLRLAEPVEAAAWYAAAVEAGAATADLLVRLAEAQLLAGEAAQARATLSRVLDKDPADAAALALMRKVPAR